MEKTIAIIQARMGSTRLPGKVLMPIGNQSMLARVISRVRRTKSLDQTVVATSTSPNDDAIVKECERIQVPVFRGSENDVLDRYYRAAVQYGATSVVRITADCPMIDSAVMELVLQAFKSKQPDYASNCLQRTYPRGLDTEVMTFSALERTWKESKFAFQRAHVTPYIYKNPGLFKLESITAGIDNSKYRWTVDTQEDLNLIRTMYARFGNTDTFSWQDAMMLMKLDPRLAAMNQHILQKEMQEG